MNDLIPAATRMMRIYAGNESGHYVTDLNSVSIEDSGKRRPTYLDVKGPPTLKEFISHLEGKKGLTIIPTTVSGSCKFGVIDIDIYPADPAKFAKDVTRRGLPLIVSLSKSKGAHLSNYTRNFESAEDMVDKLTEWAAILALPMRPKAPEIFPIQRNLGRGQFGNGINIPYFGGDHALNYALNKDCERMRLAQWLDAIESLPSKPKFVPGVADIDTALEILAPYWTEGQRDNLNLYVAGTLMRTAVDDDKIQDLLDGLAAISVGGKTPKGIAEVRAADAAGKRVPGFTKLMSIVGRDNAEALLKAMGEAPPKQVVNLDFALTPKDWLTIAPPAVTYTVQPLLPRKVVGLLVAEGGAGKTTFGLRMAIAVAGGRDFFGMPVKQGIAVHVSCEENTEALRRRFYHIASRIVESMRLEGSSSEAIDQFRSDLSTNLYLKSAVGEEWHLVSVSSGETKQTVIVDALIEYLPRPIELLILDPISRLMGGEENNNAVATGLINAAERITQETDATVLLCHHTGKASSKERESGQYAARGASGFVDAARSSIRLLIADATDTRNFSNVPQDVELIQVIHNKNNDGPRAEPFWLRRQALDFDRFEPTTAEPAVLNAQQLGRLHAWYVSNSSRPFLKTTVEALRGTIWPRGAMGRDAVRLLLAAAQSAGDLIPADSAPGPRGIAALRFRPDYAGSDM